MTSQPKNQLVEDIYNIFLVIEGNICSMAQYTVHKDTFDYDDKAVEYLKQKLEEDLEASKVFRFSEPFTCAEYYSQCRSGQGVVALEELFISLNASATPLYIATMVVDGKIRIDDSIHHGDPDIYLNSRIMGDIKMDDWLLKYSNGVELDLPQLIHDDYFLAIKTTFQAGFYVSSMKLLLSSIDSISYLEYGHVSPSNPSFVNWLNTYADLSSLKVTADELWELRNGILHMTNLSSRRVISQKVRKVSFKIGGVGSAQKDDIFYFQFSDLINVYSEALWNWFESYNEHPGKFNKFVERYDQTISDSRLAITPYK